MVTGHLLPSASQRAVIPRFLAMTPVLWVNGENSAGAAGSGLVELEATGADGAGTSTAVANPRREIEATRSWNDRISVVMMTV